jgi:S-adenosylmethionine:tRNA ribosyltransferase-isomerase
MKTSDFDYDLPAELIAQYPIEPRDSSRLMVLRRDTGSIEHRRFTDILDYLHDGDVMVFNNSRVIPARLKGKREGSGGAVEILLLRRREENVWEALVKPARRLHIGARIEIIKNASSSGAPPIIAEITGTGDGGARVVRFSGEAGLLSAGEMPLPPYIHAHLENPERYQTVYSKVLGSAAAPTAGLHFTPDLLRKIQEKGVRCLFTTLHIGLDTFRPVTEEDPQEHRIYREYGVLGKDVAQELSLAKSENRRVICVGTTATRIVEHGAAVSKKDVIDPFEGWVDLFILPGHCFRIADVLLTNFHLPKSTLLMLVSAFAGKEAIDIAYQAAVNEKYRFYSFGDAMLIL